MRDLEQQAIQAALANNWPLAIDLNLEYLQENSTDIAALNRLARAYAETGNKKAAKETYTHVLELDRYNSIALRNLRSLPQKNGSFTPSLSDEDFIEEPGLTRTISLIKIADRNTLISLCCKESVTLAPRARLVNVITAANQTIGALPDDMSFRLRHLLEKGYEYACCIKSSSDNSVTIFIRETKRPKRVTATPSFAKTTSYNKLKR